MDYDSSDDIASTDYNSMHKKRKRCFQVLELHIFTRNNLKKKRQGRVSL